MYFVYILRTYKNTLYTGITNNLKRRVREHNQVKSKAAKYTWIRRPVELVYSEKYSTITLAMRRERKIKSWTRDRKLKLIVNPTLPRPPRYAKRCGQASPARGGKMVSIDIRNYTRDDYHGVKAILQEADLFDETWDSPENLAGMIMKDKNAVLVATDDKTIIGVVYLVPFGPQFVQLFRLAVKECYRNKGIATKIIEEAQKIAKTRGAKEVGLFVESKKSDLRDFYKKRGFGGSEKGYVFMWKSIDKKNL